MPRSRSSILFSLTLAFALALVAWWTWFQVQRSGELERAGRHLVAGDAGAAAHALGAENPAGIAELAAGRRTMFLSEGIAFGAILIAIGVLFLASQRREAQLQQDHDRFLAGATHELKTPLATIRLLLESLRDDRVPPDKRQRYLQSGLLEAERLENGLTNVLTAAGLRTTPRAPRLLPGNLADDLRLAVTAITPRAEAAGVTIALAELPALTADRDADALQMVLRNLLDNAVKYSPRGSTVHVQLRAERDVHAVEIRDDGRGMDAETLAHAFVPFWRGRDSHSGGTGLGLHLVQELVRAHGGKVVAASDGNGRGSRFTVLLPQRRNG
ncbi:MAG: HAMP domain-containing histidine kinase [Planctomycetes bacterium]|nr:HAMP domain-containing histidine kinase [Planctomycetota bacterium]